VIRDVYMRDVTVGQVANAVLSIDFTYEEGDKGQFVPAAHDIVMRNVTSRRSKYGLYLRGFANAPIERVRVVECRFDGVASGNVLEHVTGLDTSGTTVNGAPFR
jgi:hypothetical protein